MRNIFRINCEQYSMSIHILIWILRLYCTYHIYSTTAIVHIILVHIILVYTILVYIILVHIILVHIILVHTILVHIILVHIILVHIWRKSYIWVRYNICGWGISGRVDDGIRYTLHISTTCQYFLKEDEILTKERCSFSFQKSFLTEWTVQRNERVAQHCGVNKINTV